MTPISKIIAAAAVCAISASMWSCGDKKKTDSSDKNETSTSSSAETTTDVTTTSEKETTTASDKTTETTVSSTETSAAQTTTTAAATEKPKEAEKKAEEAPQKGFSSSFEAAKAYYNAYLTNNADAVYDMFCKEEIEAYHAYIGTTDLLDGKNPQVVFKRSAVIDAIKQSMGNIRRIMAEKSDVPPEKWTTSLAEDTLKATGENELKDFNKTLSTEFTAGSDCGLVYYKDGNEEHDFVGNGCAFVELDGRWYLSYSSVMRSELITYMDKLFQ